MTLAIATASSSSPSSTTDSPDLEALLDSIVSAQQMPEPAAATAPVSGGTDMVSQVGHLTRKLYDTLRELGADQALEKASASISDTCERLSYVANLTDQAAHRALAAIETAKPIQDNLGRAASELHANWERFFKQELSAGQFKTLVENTRSYLAGVPAQVGATQQQLTEIMMAQDFQDLTGQVIKRVTTAAQDMQKQLLQLLVANVPADKREAAEASGLLNGPVINAGGRTDIVTSQAQVDDLLQSLGF